MRHMTALLLLLLAGTPVAGQGPITALERAEQRYTGIETLTAEFRQTIVNPMLGGPEQSKGTLYLAPPSRFAMRFEEPAGDRVVADGTWLWAYTPSTVPGQVIRQPIPAAGAATPNLLAQFVVDPLDHYEVTYVGAETVGETVVDVVRLVPLQDPQFQQAVIAISRDAGLILRLQVKELSGQLRTLVFSAVAINMPIPEAELRFDVPDGVRVVSPY